MNITTDDLSRLRWSLIFLAIALLAGGAVALISKQAVDRAETIQRQLISQQQDIRSRLSRAHEEEQDMRGRIGRYQALRDNGIIGQEERLDWVEQIERIRSQRRLLGMQYELSAQRPVDDPILPGGGIAGHFEFMASTMKLRLQLLHEDDLLGLLDDLRKAVHARLLVRDCTIERQSVAPAESGLAAQLRAECTIDWLTLREKRI
jgi:hypothetical protein